MNPEIKTLLENLEFHENKDKLGLYSRKLNEADACGKAGVTAYIDFRRAAEKGRRFYTVDGIDGFFDQDEDVNTIPVLAYFKEQRDNILTGTKQSVLQSSSTEHSEKQPPQYSPARATPAASSRDAETTEKDKLKLGTPDTKNKVPDAHEKALAKIHEIDLNPESIIKYICPNATFEEAVIFLQVCKHQNLNPFIPGEVFLIKYDKTQPASIVVGKYTFTKKADKHPAFGGYHAGIIVLTKNGEIEEREGTFYLPKGNDAKKEDVFETLLGGWAKVKRNNREDIIERVSLQEGMKLNKDGRPTKGWRDQPATMIRKVALVRALREAFPAELGGLYDKSEISIEQNMENEEVE